MFGRIMIMSLAMKKSNKQVNLSIFILPKVGKGIFYKRYGLNIKDIYEDENWILKDETSWPACYIDLFYCSTFDYK